MYLESLFDTRLVSDQELLLGSMKISLFDKELYIEGEFERVYLI
jgi:hypothetical protein